MVCCGQTTIGMPLNRHYWVDSLDLWVFHLWHRSPVVWHRLFAGFPVRVRGLDPVGKKRPAPSARRRRFCASPLRDSRFILYSQDKSGDENFNVYAIDPRAAADTATGVAFTPDLYAAAVSIVGPSNLITLHTSILGGGTKADVHAHCRSNDSSRKGAS